MSIAQWCTVDTPIGPFTAVVADDGAVLASGWTSEVGELTSLISPALAPAELKEKRDLGPVSTAIRRYHAGELDAVDSVTARARIRDDEIGYSYHAARLSWTRKNGTPRSAVIAPRGNSVGGATVRDARSAATTSVAPITAAASTSGR